MEMLEPFKENKRLCPNCLEEFYPGDCEIYATVPRLELLKEKPGNVLARMHARRYPEPLTGPYYTERMAHRRCPFCNYFLPSNIERVRNLYIAIVGDTAAGKSHFIAAMIDQIKQGKLQSADTFVRFRCLTPEVEEYYEDNYFKPLFGLKQSLPPTQLNEDIPPLIYELDIKASHGRPARAVNIILYDTGGGNYVLQQRAMIYSRHMLHADAMIFLADSMKMPEIFSRLPLQIQKNISVSPRSVTSSLDSVIDALERFRGLSAGSRRLSIPIAITLSKSDLLKYLRAASKQYCFMRNPSYGGGIDLDDVEAVDEDVRDLLSDFGEHAFLQATNAFSCAKFFASSATGHAPNDQGIFSAIHPIRCLDPLLWALYELQVIRPG